MENIAPQTAPQQYYLQVSTDLNCLNTVLSWLETIPHQHVTHDVWIKWKLAVTEGFTNAVRHAHHDLPKNTSISLRIRMSAQLMEVCIWDQGPGFDFAGAIAHAEHTDLNAKGGRGLYLIRKIADEFRYDCGSDGRNCLTIRKFLSNPDSELTI